MKWHFYLETGSLNYEFKNGSSEETRQVSDGINVDLHVSGWKATVSPRALQP